MPAKNCTKCGLTQTALVQVFLPLFHSFLYLFAFDVPQKLRFRRDDEGEVGQNAVGTPWRLPCKGSNARQRDDIETFRFFFCPFYFWWRLFQPAREFSHIEKCVRKKIIPKI